MCRRLGLLLGSFLLAGMPSAAQNLQGLSFGAEDTFDVVTWNIEWFPKSGQTTISQVAQILDLLDADVYALQEIDDTDDLQDIVDSLPGYEAWYESSFFAGLALVYDTTKVQVNATYEIYTTQPYWSPFPRSPQVMELTWEGEDFVIINNHYKCCGDGILDLGDSGDEETRRWTANNLLDAYIEQNFANDNVILVGDLNDMLTDTPANNVFEAFFDEPTEYAFADMDIATGSSANWSFPTWPSHLDHILVTNELFDELADPASEVECIKVDETYSGGWSEYDSKVSDHRPVGIRLSLDGVCGGPTLAQETVRTGSPPNPIALMPGATSGPVIGATWDPSIDHSSFQPLAFVDVLVLALQPANIPAPMGTILCDVSGAPLTFSQLAGTTFSLAIPNNCELVGKSLCVQGASLSTTSVALTNALDLVFGNL